MINNPFMLTPHVPESLFCDREQETQTVIDYVNNGDNVTIISPRQCVLFMLWWIRSWCLRQPPLMGHHIVYIMYSCLVGWRVFS